MVELIFGETVTVSLPRKGVLNLCSLGYLSLFFDGSTRTVWRGGKSYDCLAHVLRGLSSCQGIAQPYTSALYQMPVAAYSNQSKGQL
jgi:hypothetical protein